jgi:excisionase family DNA binding protein
MATSFLTNLSEEEFKIFLKQALSEIVGDNFLKSVPNLPDIMDVQQAAHYLRLQVNTLYAKTSQKIIPHFKKGHKLYFRQNELQAWVEAGKVKTNDDFRDEAVAYTMSRRSKR